MVPLQTGRHQCHPRHSVPMLGTVSDTGEERIVPGAFTELVWEHRDGPGQASS